METKVRKKSKWVVYPDSEFSIPYVSFITNNQLLMEISGS